MRVKWSFLVVDTTYRLAFLIYDCNIPWIGLYYVCRVSRCSSRITYLGTLVTLSISTYELSMLLPYTSNMLPNTTSICLCTFLFSLCLMLTAFFIFYLFLVYDYCILTWVAHVSLFGRFSVIMLLSLNYDASWHSDVETANRYIQLL